MIIVLPDDPIRASGHTGNRHLIDVAPSTDNQIPNFSLPAKRRAWALSILVLLAAYPLIVLKIQELSPEILSGINSALYGLAKLITPAIPAFDNHFSLLRENGYENAVPVAGGIMVVLWIGAFAWGAAALPLFKYLGWYANQKSGEFHLAALYGLPASIWHQRFVLAQMGCAISIFATSGYIAFAGTQNNFMVEKIGEAQNLAESISAIQNDLVRNWLGYLSYTLFLTSFISLLIAFIYYFLFTHRSIRTDEFLFKTQPRPTLMGDPAHETLYLGIPGIIPPNIILYLLITFMKYYVST